MEAMQSVQLLKDTEISPLARVPRRVSSSTIPSRLYESVLTREGPSRMTSTVAPCVLVVQ